MQSLASVGGAASIGTLHSIGRPLCSRGGRPSGSCLHSSGEHEGEHTNERETIALLDQQAVMVQCLEACLGHPMRSTIGVASLTLRKDVEASHVGEVLAQLKSSPGAEVGLPDIPRDAEYTSVRLSTPGVVFGATTETAISSALAVTHSRGGAQIWVQNDDHQWTMRFDMSAYLVRAYASTKFHELRGFDSSRPPGVLPTISTLQLLNKRKALVHITCIAWSAKFDTQSGADQLRTTPFILFAVGSRAGVVSVWKIALPLMSRDVIDATNSGAAPVPLANQHPELVCSFKVPDASSSGAFVSQLSFSSVYYDAPRHTTVCALAVGATNGQAHVYAIEPYSVNAPMEPVGLDERVPLPLHATLVTTLQLGNSFMAVSCLSWTQVISTPSDAPEAPCDYCYAGASCRKDATSAHGLEVHHMLAAGCVGQLQVIVLHPNQYLHPHINASSAEVAASASAAVAHPAVCRTFTQSHAHTAPINSLIWCVQASSSFHSSNTLATHHIQLLSSANDDIVHRWLVRDDGDADGSLQLRDHNHAGEPIAPASRLRVFPLQHVLHGSRGLVRTSDGMLLLSLEQLSASTTSSATPTYAAGKKRIPMGFVKGVPFPFLDVPDADRESFARLSVEYSTVWTGEETGLEPPPEDDAEVLASGVKAEPNVKSEKKPRKTAMEIMMEDELAERAAEIASRDQVVPMEIDVPSPPPAAAAAAVDPIPAPATPSKRPLVPVTSAIIDLSSKKPKSAARKKAPPLPKPKKKKKRRTIGEDDSEEEEEDEWKAGADDHSDSDDDDDADDATSDEGEIAEEPSFEESTPSKPKKRRPTKVEARATRKRAKLLGSHFAHQDSIPIPLPLQGPALEAARKATQMRVTRLMCTLWREQVCHRVRAQQVRHAPQESEAPLSSIGAPIAIGSMPFSLSVFSVRSLLLTLANPYELSVPPTLTEVPTAIVPVDEMQVPRGSAADTSEATPFSLFWRLLPRILPVGLVTGGLDAIFQSDETSLKLYPIDAFSLPVHRQLPFLFMADGLLEVAESLLQDTLFGRSMVHIWLGGSNEVASPSAVADQFSLRLCLCILQLVLSARTPFIALTLPERLRAESLQSRLLQALHAQYVLRQLRSLALAMDPLSSVGPADRIFAATALPLPAPLLMADWLMQLILGLTIESGVGDESDTSEVWVHPIAPATVGLVHRVFALFAQVCPAELLWFQSLFAAAGMSNADAEPSSTEAWTAALAQHRLSWPILPNKQKCPLCDAAVSLHSSLHGTCPSGHTLPRCRRTLLLLSTLETQSCHSCQGSSMNLPGPYAHLCCVCWATSQTAL